MIETTENDERTFVSALARGIEVLEAFGGRKRRMTIAEVAERTGIPRAAARRSLFTLAKLGYVAVDEDRRYHLAPRVLCFGDAYLSATPLALLGQPVLDRISDAVNESCSLGILEQNEIVYLVRSTSSRIISPALNVGRRLPAYCTSIGHVLLSELSAEALEAYLRAVPLLPFTPHTVTSKDALRAMLAQVRERGYAIADQQMEPHIRTIAVPVRSIAGEVVAGINVVIEGEAIAPDDMPPRFLQPLQLAASELRAALV